MEKRFYEANLGAISPNEMAWSGFAPAVCGAWESKRFTVLVDFGAVTPIALFEGSRIRSLIAQLDGVDTVVIGAGHNPEILSHPKVAAFVDEIRRVRPSIRIVTQRYIVVG